MTLDAADVQQITRISQAVAAEAIRNLARGTGGANMPIPITRPGTSGSYADPGAEVQVRADGDLNSVPAVNATGSRLSAGQRVVVSWLPPLGVYVTSTLGPGGIGILDKGEAFVDQSGISAVTFLAGCDVAFIGVPGREYEFIGQVEITQTIATDVFTLALTRNGVTQVKRATASNHGTEANTVTIYYSSSNELGNTTFQLALTRAVGSGTLTAGASAVNPSQLIVRDNGVAPTTS